MGWYCVFCAAAIAATWSFAMAFLRRSVRRARGQVLAQGLERERRYADLNDAIQQGAQGIVLSVQALVARLPVDDPTRRGLEIVLDQADEELAQGRDGILHLRRAADIAVDLRGRLQCIVEDLSADGRIEISLSTNGSPRTLREDATTVIHRIGREALLDAYRHAGARRIDVRLDYEAARFRLSVDDDGRAMTVPADVSELGHRAMGGLRQFAARIDATLVVDGEAGRGTRVWLTVPAARAYIHGSRSSIGGILCRSWNAFLGREGSEHAED